MLFASRLNDTRMRRAAPRSHFSLRPLRATLTVGLALLAAVSLCRTSLAEALLLVEADTGKVLHAENAGHPWYPASVTKLMTAYVTLKAVKEGRLNLDSLFTVSPIAAAQQPSKMGFKPGIQLTVDNALKMMMVKSANDMAVVLAEGVSGSIERFSDDMNAAARRLGMTQTHYVNPNGLPAEDQVTSARDLAILTRAIIADLPEYSYFFDLPAIKFGKRVMRNYNTLIGRYEGADGMKTGFICASGFNLVATATRGNRRLIAVVLGAPSSPVRAVKAAQLFERGFTSNGLSWLTPSQGQVNQLAALNVAPPNLRDDMCGPKRKRPAAETLDEAESGEDGAGGNTVMALMASSGHTGRKPSELLAAAPGAVSATVVYVGPKRSGDVQANAADEEAVQKPAAKPKRKKGAPKNATATAPAASGEPAAKKPAAGGNGKADPAKPNPTKKEAAKKDAAKKDAKTDPAKPASIVAPEKKPGAPAQSSLATQQKPKPRPSTAN